MPAGSAGAAVASPWANRSQGSESVVKKIKQRIMSFSKIPAHTKLDQLPDGLMFDPGSSQKSARGRRTRA
jgi:hypothetical protein